MRIVSYLVSILVFCLIVPVIAQQPNVLFICVDDLRPELGCYGNKVVKTPNMDALAEKGTLFANHFVTVPTCGASRYGLLTGQYPRSKSALRNSIIADSISISPEGDNPESFIHLFRRSGYTTIGIGKIAHSADGYVYGYEEPRSDQLELPHSFDEFLFNPGKWETGWNAFFAYADGSNRQSRKKQVKPYEAGNVNDEGYPDGLTAEIAIRKLEELSQQENPFFLAVGFFKPHLPFTAPQKYWDMYSEEDIPLSPAPDLPDNISRASLHGSGEFNQYALGEEKVSLNASISDEYARKLRHAYYACVSYTDAQIGKVVHKLRELDMEENTIIVLWGDHGWHLGDQRVWGKHTIFDWALRSAFIMAGPGIGHYEVPEVVSTVDIYPTFAELCSLNPPGNLDGHSLSSLLRSGTDPNWRNTAYGYFRDGVSVRTPEYRLTKYYRDSVEWELYDHHEDPFETRNVYNKKAINADLMRLLELGDTGLYNSKS